MICKKMCRTDKKFSDTVFVLPRGEADKSHKRKSSKLSFRLAKETWSLQLDVGLHLEPTDNHQLGQTEKHWIHLLSYLARV